MLFSIISFLWAGMVLGISCLEAWVKFKAPSLTKAVGLDVGRTVFRAFHKVQWGILLILVTLSCFIPQTSLHFTIIASITLVLVIQTFWLFPHLCKEVDLILAGGKSSTPVYHRLYGLLEMIKLFLLLVYGFFFL